MYEQSEEFQQELKLKVRKILTLQEWRRRKMQMRISKEEGRLKKDEEETKEMWKRKREHEEKWEGIRGQRVCFHNSLLREFNNRCLFMSLVFILFAITFWNVLLKIIEK
ncbi:uncharacterized protein LOC133880991 [Alnus glutinosa]|uniref:uncharacterized protein LOC133880991 n=1 Tax=Alnus glutinosa TaxID=3517 RepID=UPI002D783675|nr:uncharacterized protein LOC133880991 [Alnus glutinosa]